MLLLLLLRRKYAVQNPRETHAALRQQLLDDPLLLDPSGIFRRVELEVLLARSSPSGRSGFFWVIELRRPDDVAVERVDGFSPRIWTEGIRVARLWRAATATWAGFPGPLGGLLGPPSRRRHHHFLLLRCQDPVLILVLIIHQLGLGIRIGVVGSSRALEPRVRFGSPTTAVLVGAQSLPDDPADIRVVDRAAEGGLDGRQGNGTRVVVRGCPDGLGDE